MDNTGLLNPEMEAVLRRYAAIQAEEHKLKEEKAELQESLAAHMSEHNASVWFPEVDGQKLKVRHHESVVVEYDEDTLRSRLGDRYSTILAPDVVKIRRHMAAITDSLQPVLGLVGSPAREMVRCSIEDGTVRQEEFAGAFRKMVKHRIAVSKPRPDDVATGMQDG